MDKDRYISAQQSQNTMPIDVISIQSQVIYGHVGNSAAVPILEQHGLSVASIPTVILSNSPLYPTLYGGVIPDEWFAGYLNAIFDRGILETTRAIMLGYLGNPKQAQLLETWLTKVRTNYPNILVQIDPVLGDIDSGLYVDPALANVYQQSLRQLATGMTPNHFELEYLTGCKIHNIEEAVNASKSLLNDTTQWIIATSVAPKTWVTGMMTFAVITKDNVEIQKHPCYETDAKGTGDVFSATLVAELLSGKNLNDAARSAAERVMQAVKMTSAGNYNELLFSCP